MTIDISNNNPRVSYAVAQGATQTSFTVNFEFFENADLNVYVDGTKKTLTTHYTVSGGSGSTGTVTMSVTGATGGSTVVITRDTTIERTTDFSAGADINRAALNTQLDTLTAMVADVEDQASRAIQVSDHETAPSLELPSLDSRKGTVMGFNESTGAVEAGPKLADVSTLAAVTADIATLADIEDGTDATDAIQTAASNSSNISTVAGISGNVTTVAGIASNVTSVAGNATNINTVAGDTADINALAGKTTELGLLGTSDAVSDMNTLGTADVVSDMNTLGTSSNVTNMDTLAGISSNITTVAGAASDVTTVAGSISNVNTTATNISSVNTNATNISAIQGASANASTATTKASEAATSATNAASSATSAATAQTAAESARDSALAAFDNFDDKYLGAKSSGPTVDNDGDALVAGALYFDTTAGAMQVYTGSAWVAAYASLSGALLVTNNLSDVNNAANAATNLGLGVGNTPTFNGVNTTGDISFGDSDKAKFGSGNDLQIYHDGNHSWIEDSGTGAIKVKVGDFRVVNASDNNVIKGVGSVASLFYDGSEKLATTTNGINIASVGNIGTHTQDSNTNFFIGYDRGSSDVGLGFGHSAGTGRAYYPCRDDGSGVSGAIDIGTSTYKYKDLYLSGSATADSIDVGGNDTGSAGLINVYGGATGEGGEIKIYPSAANDTTINSFSIDIAGDSLRIFDSNGDMHSQFVPNGAAELYHNGSKTFETSSNGIAVTGSDYQLKLNQGSNQPYLIRHASDNSLRMHLNGTGDRLTIDANGKVGVGTSSPDLALDVSHGTASEYVATFQNTGDNLELKIGTSTGGLLNIQGANASNNSAYAFGLNADGGNVGIGTNNPDALAHIYSGASGVTNPQSYTKLHIESASHSAIQLSGSTSSEQWIWFADDTSSTPVGGITYYHGSDYMGFRTNGALRMLLENNGDLHADGNVIAYSTTISDERLKEDIKPITGALDKVGQLSGYTFTYKADGKQSAGVIAQEVEAVLPSAVIESTLPLQTDDDVEYKTVQYDQLHGLLIEAIKELKAEIEELKNGASK